MDALAVAAGACLAVGFIWLLVGCMLGYAASHGVQTVVQRGVLPTDQAARARLEEHRAATQERQLALIKRTRAIGIAILGIGVVIMIVGAFVG